MTNYLKTDLIGKVNNLKSFKSEALLPLFEAIANSIDAIEDRAKVADGKFKLSDGEIKIKIIRKQQTLSGIEREKRKRLLDIDTFEIEDNGIGFDDTNYESFNTAETTYKLKKGGKGVGRFFWLKAFNRVEIESVYVQDGKKYLRKIDFSLDRGIEEKENNSTELERKTIVKLIDFKREYRKHPSAYKKGDTIAQRILEHCISYFIGDIPINIGLYDGEDYHRINDKFEEVKENILKEEIEKGGFVFHISHIKLYSTHLKMHKMFLTANRREVKSFDMSKPELLGISTQFEDENGKFVYCAYVSSEYLDKNVDSSRIEFDIPENPNTLEREEFPVSIEEIKTEVAKRSKVFLEDYLKDIEAKKKEMVDAFISKNNPSLRAVPKYSPEVYEEIDINSSDERINEVLYKYKGKTEYQIKKRSESLLKSQVSSISEIEKQYEKAVKELDDFQKDQLAGYVIFRKMIIDLLEKKTSS
jgi:hypothetical protein